MSRRCILLRHGRTQYNEEGRYIGCHTDMELSAEGRREILRKKDMLLDLIPPDAMLFSGPLRRARETAEILFAGRQIHLLEEMRETDFGDFEGRNFDELKEDPAYQRWIDSCGKLPFPGGEGREDVAKRSMDGLYRALHLCPEDRALCIVCHGGNIMGIISSLTGKDFYDFQTGNLTGYDLRFDTDGYGIVVMAYHRLG